MYADLAYYNKDFIGNKIITDTNSLKENLILASRKIDDVTHNKIIGIGFNKLTKFQQKKIKESVCFQANHIFEYGSDDENIASFSVPDISISFKEKQSRATELNMSEMAYNSLKQTGLMCGVL